jgi:hypothetical protein
MLNMQPKLQCNGMEDDVDYGSLQRIHALDLKNKLLFFSGWGVDAESVYLGHFASLDDAMKRLQKYPSQVHGIS